MEKKTIIFLYNLNSKILIITAIFYIGYNMYYGWNLEPESKLESFFDSLVKIFINIGMIIYLIPLIYIHEEYLNKLKDDS